MAHGTSPADADTSSSADAEPARRSTRPGLKPTARPGRPAPAGMDVHKEAFRVRLVDVSRCPRLTSGSLDGLNAQCSNRCSNRAEDARLSATDVRGRPAGSH